jgi:tetratricopeptide (TPR) repeat protein
MQKICARKLFRLSRIRVQPPRVIPRVMKTGKASLARIGCVLTSTIVIAFVGCGQHQRSRSPQAKLSSASAPPDPLALVLAPHEGALRIDADIRQRQDQARNGANTDSALERLGWLFVTKARETFDPGFYKLAEQCALALETKRPHSADALLLRGHALQSQHRFTEAEAIARELVKQRGLAFDHGLLGDVLVDLGCVEEAARAYQTMLDLRPDPHGYARAAHIRWLKGDVMGAVELMRMAARGVPANDAESTAWMHTQLARYAWQAQLGNEAERSLAAALEVRSTYPPALLLQGRMLIAANKASDAIEPLGAAAMRNPLPEYFWVLSEALRATGRESEARDIEAKLARSAGSDPRTTSLYLATRGEQTRFALSLAQKELGERGDIFTHDAVAWALAANGRYDDAREHMAQALAQGTRDPRLVFHAAVIAARSGQREEARELASRLKSLTAPLLPSERRQLDAVMKDVSDASLAQHSAH